MKNNICLHVYTIFSSRKKRYLTNVKVFKERCLIHKIMFPLSCVIITSNWTV